MRAHVLLVEDDAPLAAHAVDVLRDVAMVTTVRSDDDALATVAQALPDVVITDLRGVLAGTSPVDYVAALRVRLDAVAAKVRARSPVIILASAMDPDAQRAIARALVGVVALPKPYGPRALRDAVLSATAPTRRTESP